MWGKRIGLVWGVLVALTLLGAQAAQATTIPVTCSTLESYLNGTHTVNNGDVLALTGLCSSPTPHFTIINTNAFTLEGVGNAPDGMPTSGFDGSTGTAAQLSSTAAVKLTIRNLLFEHGSFPAGDGAAIDISGTGAAPTIENDTFSNNFAQFLGGAVFLSSPTAAHQPIVIRNNSFVSNSSAAVGGALGVEGPAPLTVQANTFKGNSSPSSGGAVYLQNSATSSSAVSIASNTFGGTGSSDPNTATNNGGAVTITIAGGQPLSIVSNTFIDNGLTGTTSSDRIGGALELTPQGGVAPFTAVQAHNLFVGNQVAAGASGSPGLAAGGGEFANGVTVYSTGDEFVDNKVLSPTASPDPPEGGGLGIKGLVDGASSDEATFIGADDLFIGNEVTASGGWGGAIYTGGPDAVCHSTCPASRLTLQDSTLTGNKVSSNGGTGAAIWGSPTDTLSISNSIVYGNPLVTFIAHKAAPRLIEPPPSEIVGYSSPTYQYSDICTSFQGTMPVPGMGNICKSPALAANGAETAASPTIDRGSSALVPAGLSTDVAGAPRVTVGLAVDCPNAVVDMGAFESRGVSCARPGPSCHLGKLRRVKHKPSRRTVSIRCKQAASGVLKLVVREVSGKGKNRKVKFVNLRAKTLSLKANKALKVNVKLPKKVLRALSAGKRCTLILTLSATDSSGTSETTKKYKLKR